MSLETPIKIRMLQRKLYQKAKGEPNYRFYLLYDKMYREDILAHAYALVKSNQGAPGVDGQTFWGIETLGLEEWLDGIRMDLRAKTYQPQAVRRVMIPKPGGGERPLGIPTIRDRVVQTAAKLLLEPILEADFDPNAYGYRPKRSARDAIQKVYELLRAGHTDVVDADLSKYFDTIPHRELIQCVARRVVDRDVLHLIKMWLKVPVEERDENGKQRMSGGGNSTCGTPQGGVMTPRTQKITLNLIGGWSFCGSRVSVDVCRIGLYVYDRCPAPTRPRKPSASIARGTCCCASISSPMRSNGWPRTVPFRRVKLIATSNKLSV
jgi:RNA-directed DNA polymerase